MNSFTRRYDIDALRVIALGLLIAYHIFLAYQPFAHLLRFVEYDQFLVEYWFIGDLLNIWRIPVLFVVSGMALGFVLRRRSIKEVFHDRMIRLVPPLIFGSVLIAPIFYIIHALDQGQQVTYAPTPGHLWFVMNLVTYSIIVLPVAAWFKRHPENWLIRGLRWTLPVGLLLFFAVPLMLESALSQPDNFTRFYTRFWYGLISYVLGFVFISLGDKFWSSLRLVCHVALPLAVVLFLSRSPVFEWEAFLSTPWMTALESAMWMLAFLGYGSLILNRPSKTFAYLNKAVFPIYILHMPVQQALALVIFPWGLSPVVTFGIHVVVTMGICLALYEGVIRRCNWLHPVMGLKLSKPSSPTSESPPQPSRWARFGTAATLYVLGPLVALFQLGGVAYLTVHGTSEVSPNIPRPGNAWGHALNNDVESLRELIAVEDFSIDEPDSILSMSPLHWAAFQGSAEVAKVLLDAGAEVDLRAADRSTPLHIAAFLGHADTAAVLIDHGADVNLWNAYRRTPLDNTWRHWGEVRRTEKTLLHWVKVRQIVDRSRLSVEKEEWDVGREKVRALLLSRGAKRRSELSP